MGQMGRFERRFGYEHVIADESSSNSEICPVQVTEEQIDFAFGELRCALFTNKGLQVSIRKKSIIFYTFIALGQIKRESKLTSSACFTIFGPNPIKSLKWKCRWDLKMCSIYRCLLHKQLQNQPFAPPPPSVTNRTILSLNITCSISLLLPATCWYLHQTCSYPERPETASLTLFTVSTLYRYHDVINQGLSSPPWPRYS